jgi:hypothetical protein
MSTFETAAALKDCANKALDTTPGNKNFAPEDSGKFRIAEASLTNRYNKLDNKPGFFGSDASKGQLDLATKPALERYNQAEREDADNSCKNLLASAQALGGISNKNLPRENTNNTSASLSANVTNPALRRREEAAGLR